MLKKILVLLKYPIVIIVILAGVISCEKDFKNIGENLVDNNLFSTGNYSAKIKAHSVRNMNNKTNGMDHYLLGYTSNTQFGSLRASVITQLTLPEANPNFGTNAVIDSVVIVIPYISTLKGKQTVEDPFNPLKTISVPDYQLDSVWTGGTNKNFQLKVYELGTYLNALNPQNPYIANEIFSNDVFQKTGTPFYTGLVSPNRNDTMMVINRYKYASTSLTNRVLYKKDTIKLTNSKPSLKIPIDKQRIKQIFQDNTNTTHFVSNENFKHFFRGFYLEALNSGNGTAAMYLKLSDAYMTIYYSETKITDETATQDLNGNGIFGELNVLYPIPGSFTYNMSGIKANLFERNHSGTIAESYLLNPNVAAGEDKLFLHGAAGSDAKIHLFGDDLNNNNIPDEIEILRTKNWLVNDAKLYLYVDAANNTNQYPDRLYLYSFKDNIQQQSYEVLKQGTSSLGGALVKNTDGNPDYYLFHLTDYVSEILKSNTEVPITDFGVKVYDPSDFPTSASDTIMRKFGNNYKGVIISGNNVPISQTRKLKLEILYTEKN